MNEIRKTTSMQQYLFFFFFKKKTAYEITYGDWSSDVCSSDLSRSRAHARDLDRRAARRSARGLDPRPQLRSRPMSASRYRFVTAVVLALAFAARVSASTSGVDAAAALREAGDRYE